MAIYNIRTSSVQNWRDTMMSKAEFNALAAERRANRAGSGFDEWGKGSSATSVNVNEGIYTSSTLVNGLELGRVGGTGISATDWASTSINGVVHTLKYGNYSTAISRLLLPPAPTVLPYGTVLTQQQIDSGVIKHADASNSGLIVNGKFDTDTSGWAAYTADTAALAVAGEMKLTSTIGYARQSQGYATVIGKKYIIEFEAYRGTTSAILLYVGVAQNNNSNGSITLTNVSKQRFILEFIATSSVSYITVRVNETGAGTTGYFDNIAVFPADAISRSDLTFLESWHEDISEKDFVYPLGNVQYLGTTGDAGTPVAGAFAGYGTYSLFSDTWQADGALVGKGYVWSSLSDANKKAFVANPENNCYLDGDKVIQVRYRMRVVAGMGDSWANVDTQSLAANAMMYGNFINYVTTKGKFVSIAADISSGNANSYRTNEALSWYSGDVNGLFIAAANTSIDTTVAYEGKCYAIPIALVHRRNQGAYHPVYNANGTKAIEHLTATASDKYWYFSDAKILTSISDAFSLYSKSTTTGRIGDTNTPRPDNLKYDQIHEGDILDLRNSSQKVEDYNRLIDREFNKAIAGTTRGSQGEINTEVKTQTTTGTVATVEVNDGTKYKSGDIIYIYDLTASTVKGRFVVKSIATNTLTVDVAFAKLANSYMISGGSTTRTKSNNMTITDLIGSPSNLPSNMKIDGQSFNTLHTAEDGTSLLPTGALTVFKLSHKATATPLQVLKSTDSGTTWTALTVTTHYAFNTTTNAITMVSAPATTDLIMVTYNTHTNMAVAAANSEVLAIGDAMGNGYNSYSFITQTLIGKVGTIDFANNGIATSKLISVGVGSPLNIGPNVKPSHSPLAPTVTTSPVVKVFPYLTRSNGKAYLQLVFKEMKCGADWGDDSKFNIVDNVSTTTDDNGATVLIGQKRIELPYFIGAGE